MLSYRTPATCKERMRCVKVKPSGPAHEVLRLRSGLRPTSGFPISHLPSRARSLKLKFSRVVLVTIRYALHRTVPIQERSSGMYVLLVNASAAFWPLPSP